MIETGQYADLANGIRLHYASVGKPPARPILFLHGFPEYWGREDLLPCFADVARSLRTCAASTCRANRPTLPPIVLN
jgi:pimeloyl-ACP methyl ester carboxylesterase